MNILHMKYAYEVAKAGSLSKAAESLVIAAPNLSRSIKELEAELGITIFERTSKGMILTSDGEVFIDYARSILAQINNMEQVFKRSNSSKKVFSIAVPRASYISDAFVNFIRVLKHSPTEIFYQETNSQQVINNILQQECALGIIRYNAIYDSEYKQLLEDKELNYEFISEFDYQLVTSSNSPLASKEDITVEDLTQLVEISYRDDVTFQTDKQGTNNSIMLMERTSRIDLLCSNHLTYMFESPVPASVLNKNSLVQKVYKAPQNTYKDVLIYKNNYKPTELDNQFITELCNSRRRNF